MPKKCKAENCNLNNFSHGYCQRHQYLRTDRKAIQSRERTKNLKRVKRLADNKKATQRGVERLQKKYKDSRQDFFKHKKRIGEYRCVFCGKPIEEKPDVHHLFGRDGELLTDWRYFELAHRKCHTSYHSLPVNKLEWFDGYLERIKRFPKLYEKEKFKRKKL